MGNTCKTCNCDGKGEATPNEFTIQVNIFNFYKFKIGSSLVYEELQLVG